MGSDMKTTIDISDALFAQASKIAAEEGVTLGELVEEALHRVIQGRRWHEGFALRDAAYGAGGLADEARGLSWPELLDLSYQGPGER